jgi:hypothetical protein
VRGICRSLSLMVRVKLSKPEFAIKLPENMSSSWFCPLLVSRLFFAEYCMITCHTLPDSVHPNTRAQNMKPCHHSNTMIQNTTLNRFTLYIKKRCFGGDVKEGTCRRLAYKRGRESSTECFRNVSTEGTFSAYLTFYQVHPKTHFTP